MNAIRKFQEERQEWEAEREELERKLHEVTALKDEAQHALFPLAQEVERLRDAKNVAEAAKSNAEAAAAAAAASMAQMAAGQQNAEASTVPAQDEAAIKAQHEKQMALLEKMDELRSDLEKEQSRARELEQRAAEAELQTRKAAVELDAAKSERMSLENSRNSTKGIEDTMGAMLESRHREVTSLQDENLRLREELNQEKQRVIELKQSAHKRKETWKQQLGLISDEIALKERLEEEVERLRTAQIRFREEVALAKEREAAFRRDLEVSRRESEKLRRDAEMATQRADRLQQELQDARETIAVYKDAAESASPRGSRRHASRRHHTTGQNGEREPAMSEFRRLSDTMGSQLQTVEQELSKQTEKHAQLKRLVELFLDHALSPLDTLRRVCRHFAAVGEAGRDIWMRQVPPLHEPKAQDLQDNLVRIITLLRFCQEVLQAREKQSAGQDVIVRGIEDSKEYAKSWIRSTVGS